MNNKMIFIAFLICLIGKINAVPKLPEIDLDAKQLIRYWGYPIEIHHVTTEDGYILETHRIPHGKKNSTRMPTKENPKPVFVLHHPLDGASSAFILNPPHQSIAFVLADAGFDVWMGNARGNRYSQRHKTLNVTDDKFWDFSFQDIAEFDCTAIIDYALELTGNKHVYFVGHSQGTIVGFAALAEKKELQDKIKVLFATGPVTRIKYTNDFVKLLASFEKIFKFVCKIFDIREILGSASKADAFAKRFCPYMPHFCETFLFILNGFDHKRFNLTRVPIYTSHIPAGTSVKNLDHFFQLINSKEFRKYDHGYWENLKRYGSEKPPFYDLTKISTHVVMLYGSEDTIVDPRDVDWAVERLQSSKKMLIEGYNHIDFILAKDAAETVYCKIIDIARRLEMGMDF